MINENLKYTSKDYNSIYTDLVSSIPTLTNIWTNTEEGDPGIVLVKLMSSLGDMLSYNMDKQALEYYASTVTQRKNAAKLFNLIGYRMHWYRSATNQVSVTNTVTIPNNYKLVLLYQQYKALPESSIEAQKIKEEYKALGKYLIPNTPENSKYYTGNELDFDKVFSEDSDIVKNFNDNYGTWLDSNTLYLYTYLANPNKTIDIRGNDRSANYYIIKPTTYANVSGDTNVLTADVSIEPGQTQKLDVIQGTLCSTTFNSFRMRNNRYYLSESAIDENNIWLSYTPTQGNYKITDTKFISKTDTLLTVTDDNIYFEFNVDEFDIPYIELSSYWTEALGDSVNFTLYYVRTDGVYGNITKNFLSVIEGLPRGRYTINHPANTSPYIDEQGKLIATVGKHPESAQQAYKNSMNYVTTFDTLVTIYDFERFCKRQEGITNTYAIDIQRANDINTEVGVQANAMSLAQLQSYYDEATKKDGQGADIRDKIDQLRTFYTERKKVHYNDSIPGEEFVKYGLSLYVVYGNFDTYMQDTDYEIASIQMMQNLGYWTYRINSNYVPDKNKVNYDKIEDAIVPGDKTSGYVAKYLDTKFRDIKIANIVPEYAAIRVFPWRCCGTIHLKNPVTKATADKILETVMSHLRYAFNPANLEFGKKINYMDVITTVTESHDMIRYFDAGIGNRKLIDIDKSVDFTYFNNSSLMYFVQSLNGLTIGESFIPGNNQKKISEDEDNPYYNILSIAPEYIIDAVDI